MNSATPTATGTARTSETIAARIVPKISGPTTDHRLPPAGIHGTTDARSGFFRAGRASMIKKIATEARTARMRIPDHTARYRKPRSSPRSVGRDRLLGVRTGATGGVIAVVGEANGCLLSERGECATVR